MLDAETTPGFTEALRLELRRGASYPKANALALEAVVKGAGAFLAKPNNMLAMSYLREIAGKGYGLEVLRVRREGECSSRAVREGRLDMMPEFSRKILAGSEHSDPEKLWPLFQAVMLRSKAEDLRKLYGIDEGIEGLFIKHWKEADGLEDFIGRCVCARYTRAHIRRRVVYVLLGLDREAVRSAIREGVPYARVLGFNARGREILRNASCVKVITRLAEARSEREKYFADVEARASQLYELTLPKPYFKRETQKPVIIPPDTILIRRDS